MINDRAVCTVTAFMVGAPVPPPGLAQKILASIYRYRFEIWGTATPDNDGSDEKFHSINRRENL